MILTNLATILSLYFGSGRTSRFLISPLRGINELLGLFRPVLGTTLAAILDSDGIQGAPDNMVPHAREIFDPAASDHNHGVLLKIMTNTRNIRGHFNSIR